MTRRRLAIAALAAVALATAGPARAEQLVALGDSFSSGEGALPYVPGDCHRSPRAWPLLLAGRLDMSARSLACTGARIPDLEPQLAALARTGGVELVTVTIGGNDLGFGEVLTTCVLRDCRRHYTRGGRDEIDLRIADLRPRLPEAYRRIAAAAPGARLLVLGYPRLFPRRPARFTCAALNAISRREARWLNAKTKAADRAIAAAARAAGAAYAHALHAFEGHELACRGLDRYVNNLHFLRGGLIGPASFHPNANGYARLADLALEALAERVLDR